MNYKDLDVYVKAYEFVLDCYPTSDSFLPSEDKAMYDQLKRALLSIPLNIAEGCGSRSQRVLRNHLSYSYGSCCEVEVLLSFCRDLCYMHEEVVEVLLRELDRIKGMLYSFLCSVEKGISSGNVHASYKRKKV